MYLLRPSHWFRRAGGSSGGGGGGGGGGRGGGGGSSGGSRGGSTGGSTGGGSTGGGSSGGGKTGGSSGSSSGSRGTSGSGSTGSTLRSGGSSSSTGRGVTTSVGRLGSTQRGQIYNRPSSSFYNRGASRPIAPYVLLFGFWPIYWYYDYPEGGTPTNNTRPGGNLITAAIIPPNISPSSANTTYIIYGDQQSIEDMLPALVTSCAAVNSSSSFNTSSNTTMQLYREDSFALLGVGLNETGRNSTFESCLNDTISDNIIVLDSWGKQGMSGLGSFWGLIFLACLFGLK